MREYFEELELKYLADYAVKSRFSKGRKHEEAASPTRTCFQRDRDRIIHSKAFRRLKHKTQVFIATESDHYRSRMTHTLEVSQISRHLSRMMRLNEDLSESIALAHDLGHTPFGHAGERTLNELMKDDGGFEHNFQSLRIVQLLEEKYPSFRGLNLSYEVVEGLKKHSTPWDQPDTESKFTSLEAQICNIADEIAYNNHDIDDGLASGLLVEADINTHVALWRDAKAHIQSEHQALEERHLFALINSYLISSQIMDVYHHSNDLLKRHGIQRLEDVQEADLSLINFSPEMHDKNKELRKYLFQNFYSHYKVYRMNKKGQYIIRQLFDAFRQDSRLLPDRFRSRIRNEENKNRVIADYIAGMTDTYAVKEFESIFQ